MGKKIVIITLLALIFAAAIIESVYVAAAVKRLSTAMDNVQQALEADDAEAAKEAARELEVLWENEKKRFEALYEHCEVDVISATTRRIEVFCDEEDTVNALAEVTAGQFYIDHLREMIGVRWENIL
jgi:hypothetical protein